MKQVGPKIVECISFNTLDNEYFGFPMLGMVFLSAGYSLTKRHIDKVFASGSFKIPSAKALESPSPILSLLAVIHWFLARTRLVYVPSRDFLADLQEYIASGAALQAWRSKLRAFRPERNEFNLVYHGIEQYKNDDAHAVSQIRRNRPLSPYSVTAAEAVTFVLSLIKSV